jgi:hypothetical protein
MLDRCRNPNNPQYDDYGARFGEAHPDWQTFEGYYADTGDPPSPELTRDRTDNNRGYAPDNFRWADRHTQRINQRPRAKTKTKQKRSPPASDPEEDVPW